MIDRVHLRVSDKVRIFAEISNKLDYAVDFFDFLDEERKIIKDTIDILDNKVALWEEIIKEQNSL